MGASPPFDATGSEAPILHGGRASVKARPPAVARPAAIA